MDQQERDHMGGRLVSMARLAQTAMSNATTALLSPRVLLGEDMTNVARALHTLRHEIENHACLLLATDGRRPLADLRVIIAGAHISSEVECMGSLARQVADIAGAWGARPPVSAEFRAPVGDTLHGCLNTVARAGDAMETGTGPESMRELDRSTDELRVRLNGLYTALLSEHSPTDARTAVDATLVARYCERYANHAHEVAWHLAGVTAVASHR